MPWPDNLFAAFRYGSPRRAFHPHRAKAPLLRVHDPPSIEGNLDSPGEVVPQTSDRVSQRELDRSACEPLRGASAPDRPRSAAWILPCAPLPPSDVYGVRRALAGVSPLRYS